MQTTVIVPDNAVYQDGVFYANLNLSSCSIPENVRALQFNGTNGWIEFNDGSENQNINALPAWALSAIELWQKANNTQELPPNNEALVATCKAVAKQYLQETDWALLPDVLSGSQKLSNQTDFLTYRSIVRELAINPIPNPSWPTLPTAQWVS